jgi:CHAT domain-containing protein
MAELAFLQGHWKEAVSLWERNTAWVTRNGAVASSKALEANKKQSDFAVGWHFKDLVKAFYRLSKESPGGGRESGQALIAAQWDQALEAAQAIAQMATRAAVDPAIAQLARERQDLAIEREKREQYRLSSLTQAPAARNPEGEQDNVTRISAIDARMAAIDADFRIHFPDYQALANPIPLSVAEIQEQLNANEALILFLDTTAKRPTGEETFAWVITKTESRFFRADIGSSGLAKEVMALRCGLDASGWSERGMQRREETGALASCRQLLGVNGPEPGKLPFDLARAHALYQALFGQAEDLIQGKQLLIVLSGPLTALPFQVLVTEKPGIAIPSEVAGYASAKWLGQRQPITVLPSVASLKSLRRHAGKSAAPSPYIGFGNPLLTGESGSDRSAWAAQSCNATQEHTLAAPPRGLARPYTELYKTGGDGVADVEALRRQPPLPDTADELCAVAKLAGASSDSIYLGARATEARVAALSQQGALAKVRVVHFATHGLVAGEVQEIAKATKAEPALLLTPPLSATEEDDGLLTASEVAALKLDADWVILSACNTAAGGEKGGEALSGLARAFFYAGARALLVSHWYVNSAATVDLITGAFGEMQAHPEIGRAEAMRRAMAALIARGGRNAHPAFWAPFAVVGEGAAAR